jgi:uncharacterized protein (DUF1501 family)
MVTRRVFIRNGGLALVSLGFAPRFLARTAEAAAGRRKVLVAIFQRGAVDGLNMIVPFGERAYYQARPTIAIGRPGSGEEAGIDLDGFFALHPRLAPLARLFRAGELAIVHACGSHDATRSHFDAQDYMESGTPGVKSTEDGWLNRYLQAERLQDGSAFRAVALDRQLPRSLQGRAAALALNRIDRFGIRGGRATETVATSFEQQYADAADRVLNATGREAFEAVKLLRQADPSRYRPEHGASYPRSPFGDAMRQIAQLVKADVGLEIAFAESQQWDHHVNEGGATGILANRLDDLARGIAAFTTDLDEAMEHVVVLTMSEFGRAVGENGNRGTDHGHGNAMLAIGGPVRGGKVYGKWPGIEPAQRFEGRDLAVTTDFRDVFGEVVVRHLGLGNTRTIFPGYSIDPSRFAGFVR